MIQWSPSNPDTNGTEESVDISEVTLFQGLNHIQELFVEKGVPIQGVLRGGVLLYICTTFVGVKMAECETNR